MSALSSRASLALQMTRMTPTSIAVDTGATHTRLAVGEAGTPFEEAARSEREIDSTRELLEFIAGSMVGLGERGQIVLAGGFAGPSDGHEIRMTNWGDDDPITVNAFADLGVARAVILNDLEAAAWGLVSLLDSSSPEGVVGLAAHAVPEAGHRVLIMPGTGLGSAGILDNGPASAHLVEEPGGGRWRVVPGEAQHTVASERTAAEALVIARAAEVLGRPPSWDDLVSGRGLELIYRVVEAQSPDDDSEVTLPDARLIGARAAAGDPGCLSALEAYYGFAASFAQTLALTFKSAGGVFVAGSSTRDNLDVIRAGSFAEQLRESHAMARMLSSVPVFAVTAELNLRGAWSHAAALARALAD